MESLEDEKLIGETQQHLITASVIRGIISTQKYEFQSITFKILKEK